MKILSVDTANGPCSVALFADGEVIAEKIEESSAKQAEKLVQMIEDILLENNLHYEDLGLIACVIGPGSFTGIRIGLAAIKGITLVKKIPTIAINTLEAIAWKSKEDHPSEKNILALLNARRDQVYSCILSNDLENSGNISLINNSEIETVAHDDNLLITGNCVHIIEELDNIKNEITENIMPTAADIALLAAFKFNKGDYSSELSPTYIRKPDAKKSSVARRQSPVN